MRLFALRGLDHLRPVGVEMDHRLLAIDVFAGLHGVDGDLLVPVVGRADDDGIDVFAFQNLGVVAGGEDDRRPRVPCCARAGRRNNRPRQPASPREPAPRPWYLPGPGRRRRSARSGYDRSPLRAWQVRIEPRPANGFSTRARSPPLPPPLPPLRKLLRFNSCTVVPHSWKLSAVCNHTAFMPGKARWAGRWPWIQFMDVARTEMDVAMVATRGAT